MHEAGRLCGAGEAIASGHWGRPSEARRRAPALLLEGASRCARLWRASRREGRTAGVTVTRYATLGLLLRAPFAACGKKIGMPARPRSTATRPTRRAPATSRSPAVTAPSRAAISPPALKRRSASPCPPPVPRPSHPSTKHCSATMPCAPDEYPPRRGRLCASRLSEVRQCMLQRRRRRRLPGRLRVPRVGRARQQGDHHEPQR